jgi:branched-chain amino acid transport system ATP-binding protein
MWSVVKMGEPLLSVKKVTKRFGGLIALKDLSFNVYSGEVVGLMGPNGAGKTTLLNVIAGEYTPDEGAIIFNGRDISRCPPHKTCRMGIARTYQIPQPFISLSVSDNLLVSALYGRHLTKSEGVLENDKIFDLVGLADKKNVITGELAILLLKKLELARALAQNPQLLLLDEVAAGLTETEIPKILETIKEIRRMGITVILIEHVMKVMVNAVDRIVVIDKGMKIAEGEPKAIMENDKVIEAYFGA